MTETLKQDINQAFDSRLSLSLDTPASMERTNSLSASSIHSNDKINDHHDFRPATYSRPTYCDLCSNFIWGLTKQGHSCADCGYNTHKKCLGLVMTPCHPTRGRTSTDSPGTIRKRSTSNSTKKVERSDSATRKSTATKQTPKREESIVTELFAQAQVQSVKLGNALADANPALSVTVFIKNNNRFVARQTPLIWLNNTIISLLTWQSIPHTLIFLLCYIILCLHPFLIPILPQMVLIYLMIRFYHYRADDIVAGRPLPKPHPIGTSPKLSPSFAEQKDAMQNIQNTMSKVSDAYDAGYNLYRMIDWSNPEQTKDVLMAVIASMFGTLLVLHFIPINIIALFGGVGIFLANTAIVKAATITLTPHLVKKLQRRVEHVKTLIKEAQEKGQEPIIDVVLFENQRWWAGVGWVPALLSSERSSWTDETGTIKLSNKEDYEIPTAETLGELVPNSAHHKGVISWIDNEWEVDVEWTGTDEDGWEYTNQIWQQPRSSRTMGSFTRRRKWVRHLILKN
ncbi:integral peroxisomal membrane peroxin-domain-containing protein [Globomyces pollinis-pini]|nr:integral peroxisomal membrane peroxin-domain-containing protein [Globomyces pollinis-pini]